MPERTNPFFNYMIILWAYALCLIILHNLAPESILDIIYQFEARNIYIIISALLGLVVTGIVITITIFILFIFVSIYFYSSKAIRQRKK